MKLSELIKQLQDIHAKSWADCDVCFENEDVPFGKDAILNLKHIISRPTLENGIHGGIVKFIVTE